MSYSITTDVFCDECGDWVHGCVSYKVRKITASNVAIKEHGWHINYLNGIKKHYCPDCWKKICENSL